MPNPWELYDWLIESIPSDVVARRVLIGNAWTAVETDEALGLAMTHRDETSPAKLQPPYAGRSLRDLAAGVRSWNVREAAIGLAAINAHFNSRVRVEDTFGRSLAENGTETVFDALRSEVEGKKVAVIGHFPGLQAFGQACHMSILERNPQNGDFPDFAAEYILPEQDYVFMTGTTIVNKTLPRLLQICAESKVVLVGPSVPLAPAWFGRGVVVIAGTVALRADGVWGAVAEGEPHDIWKRGAITVQFRAGDRL
jgi:uncharacterized protein